LQTSFINRDLREKSAHDAEGNFARVSTFDCDNVYILDDFLHASFVALVFSLILQLGNFS